MAALALGLDRDHAPDPDRHRLRQVGVDPALPPDDLPNPNPELTAVEAAGAPEQVALHLGPGRLGQLAVQIGLQLQERPLAVHHVTKPRSRLTSHNRRSRALLPRWRRDITVPIGTSRISAISL